ncbi:MAG: HEAT repeat domain-containing protein [Terriglobia bacterium]
MVHNWNGVKAAILAVCSCLTLYSAPIEPTAVAALIVQGKTANLKALGPGVLPVMVGLYESSDETQRTRIAETFYQLGWKSPEAKRVLMKDVHTSNQYLRLQVQWALGRVSNDNDVVDVLLENMGKDANPLFRDKAACALAYDQIHLTEKQKVRLYEGLIQALSDLKLDVRRIALQALQIHTGQTKGFNPEAQVAERDNSIRQWKRWLEEYKSNL